MGQEDQRGRLRIDQGQMRLRVSRRQLGQEAGSLPWYRFRFSIYIIKVTVCVCVCVHVRVCVHPK